MHNNSRPHRSVPTFKRAEVNLTVNLPTDRLVIASRAKAGGSRRAQRPHSEPGVRRPPAEKRSAVEEARRAVTDDRCGGEFDVAWWTGSARFHEADLYRVPSDRDAG